MLTAVLLSGDSKFAGQIDLWMRQVSPDKFKFVSCQNLEAYKAMLVSALNPPPDAAPGSTPSAIKLFLIDVDILGNKPLQWIADLQKITRETAPTLIQTGVPKVLVMAYETGTHKPDAFQNDVVDDLILRPMEKALFQQKVEFLMTGDPKNKTPTFLFRAKASQMIEIGRDVAIDEISEFALAVRSPGPLPEGSFASIHAEIFGTKGGRRLLARVYESGKHPVREGEFLVKFGLFGVTADQLSAIRRFVKANQMPIRTSRAGAGGGGLPGTAGAGGSAGAGAAKAGLSKELLEKMAMLKMRKVAVIDMNPDSLNELKSMVETGFKGLVVKPFPSYVRLAAEVRKLLPETAIKAADAAKGDGTPMPPAFLGGRKLTLIVRGKTFDTVKLDPAPKKTDAILGRAAQDWLDKPEQWLSAVEKDDRDALQEFLQYVDAGNVGRGSFRMVDSVGRHAFIEATGTIEKSGAADGTALLKIDLNEVDAETFIKNLTPTGSTPAVKDPSAYKFDLILMDSALLRSDAAGWYERMTELYRAAKIINPDEAPPKVVLIHDSKTKARPDDYRVKGIADFVYKPLDRRYLIQKLNALCPSLIPARDPEVPPWVPCEIIAKLGKDVVMDEIAEFGLVVQHPSPFKEKTHMRFFSPLFGDEGEWVSGRCAVCEKLEGDGPAAKGQQQIHRCQFMFFGPNDELLQRIRRWIREDYVAKKDSKG